MQASTAGAGAAAQKPAQHDVQPQSVQGRETAATTPAAAGAGADDALWRELLEALRIFDAQRERPERCQFRECVPCALYPVF